MTTWSRDRLVTFIFFALTAWLATTPEIHHFNRVVSTALRPLGIHIPELQLIWVLGGIPLTFLTVLFVAWRRHDNQKPWVGVVLGFVLGSLIEVLAKHFIVLPNPPNVPPAGFYRVIVRATNITPGEILRPLSLILGSPTGGASHFSLLRGTFPSGHLFRITYTLLALAGRRRPSISVALAAAVASLCVVATGGHWIWDAVGGVALATCMATWVVSPRESIR